MLEAQEEGKECFMPWAFIPLILARLQFDTHTLKQRIQKQSNWAVMLVIRLVGLEDRMHACEYSSEGSWFYESVLFSLKISNGYIIPTPL